MADILQDLYLAVPPERVFAGVTEPALLDQWWTLGSSGRPEVGTAYTLDFGPGYAWQAEVTRAVPDESFELRMTRADRDWMGTRVGFAMTPALAGTQLRFHHLGWPEANEHHRISCHCWALYLRVLRRHLEFGETVPYDRRLDV